MNFVEIAYVLKFIKKGDRLCGFNGAVEVYEFLSTITNLFLYELII
jgi:hypothetical protein